MTAPTSDERREVASALRGDHNDTIVPQSRDGFEGMTYQEAAYRFWDMCRRVRSVADVDIAYSTTSVLADLIDPTCQMKGIPESSYRACSRCGAFVRRDAATNCTEAITVRFCPNCGARVIVGGEG